MQIDITGVFHPVDSNILLNFRVITHFYFVLYSSHHLLVELLILKPKSHPHQSPLIPLHNLPKLNQHSSSQHPDLLILLRRRLKHLIHPLAYLHNPRREVRHQPLFPRASGRDVKIDDCKEQG